MATETLAVKLLLDSNQYQRSAREAASATGRITDSANTAGTATGTLDRKMGGLATTAKFALAGIATAAVTNFARDSIDAASSLNESLNAVDKTFGDMADGINRIGAVSAESFGLSQSEFNSFAVQFSNFASTIAEGDGRSVVDIIGEITARTADFASVMDLDVPEAAAKFQSALAGQVEPLRAYGIDVSAAAVTQKALEMGLADSSAELTEQDKILARYAIIMQETDKFAGDFTDTQDELANATRTANAQFEDFQAQIGQFAIPVITEYVGLGSDLITVLSGLTGAIDGVTDAGWSFIDFLEFVFPPTKLLTDGLGWLADRFRDVDDAASGAASSVGHFSGGGARRNAISFAGPRASGGPVRAGSAYLVGEAGPELFVPAAAGQIISNTELTQSARGGGTSRTVVNIGNVYGWDDFVRKVNEAGITINRYGWADG